MHDGVAGSRIMSSSNIEPGKTRLFFLDWLRVFACGLLVVYHAGLIFVEWGYHIQNDTLMKV
jgi:peptidoglycan/LPS O-acetylase OafA/YrhL